MQEKTSKDPLQSASGTSSRFYPAGREIKAWGEELGFQDICIADAGAEHGAGRIGLHEWLRNGYHGEMDYMAKHGTRRTRPAELVPGTLRVISARMNYMPPERETVGK